MIQVNLWDVSKTQQQNSTSSLNKTELINSFIQVKLLSSGGFLNAVSALGVSVNSLKGVSCIPHNTTVIDFCTHCMNHVLAQTRCTHASPIPPTDVPWPLLENYFSSPLVTLPRSLPSLSFLYRIPGQGLGSSEWYPQLSSIVCITA